MASTIESPFFFEPWPGSGVNIPDYADPMVMSNSFGSFFDDALLAKVSSSRAPPRLNDFSFDPDKHDRHDVVHSRTHLDQNSQTIARDDVLSDAPSWDINEPDAERTEIVTYESKPQEQATATIRSGPEGGSKRGNSNKSRNQFSSARGHPKKTTGAEDARKKREQNLEKNRIAANKCRQRKKDWVAKIDNRHRDLAAHNKFLTAEVDSLSSAVFELKVLAFQHVECGYAPIHEYIKREAERVPVRARSRANTWLSMKGSPLQNRLHPGASPTSNSSDSDSSILRNNDPQMRTSQSTNGGARPAFSDSTSLQSMSITPEGNGAERSWFGMS